MCEWAPTPLCPWSCLPHQAQPGPLEDHVTPGVSEVKQSLLPSTHHPGHPRALKWWRNQHSAQMFSVQPDWASPPRMPTAAAAPWPPHHTAAGEAKSETPKNPWSITTCSAGHGGADNRAQAASRASSIHYGKTGIPPDFTPAWSTCSDE